MALLFIPLMAEVTLSVVSYAAKQTQKVDTQDEYSTMQLPEMIELKAGTTFHVKQNLISLSRVKLNPKKWIFMAENDADLLNSANSEYQDLQPKFVVRIASKKQKLEEVLSENQVPLNDIWDQYDDPFLEWWRKERKDPAPVYLASNASYARNLFTDLSGSAEVVSEPSGNTSSAPEKPSEEQYIIEAGHNRPASVLNVLEPSGQYLSYANIEGQILGLSNDQRKYFFEVSFLDQLAPDGLETAYSTVLAAQEIYDATSFFMLRLPAESRGHVLAKAFAREDIDKKVPLFVGRADEKMLYVSQDGIRGLKIQLLPTKQYLAKYETVFEGSIENTYRGAIEDVKVWVAETNESVKSNEVGMFTIKGLEKDVRYHLIFDREGFIPIQVPVFQTQKRVKQTFHLLPTTAFTKGYDLFLGERNANQGVLFGEVLQDGKPLDRVVIKISSGQSAIYERNTDLQAMPDTTLYSTQSNGKFIIWNNPVGKNKIEFYRDGALISAFMVRLSPGLVHQEVFHIQVN